MTEVVVPVEIPNYDFYPSNEEILERINKSTLE